jgi:hypothetical protein
MEQLERMQLKKTPVAHPDEKETEYSVALQRWVHVVVLQTCSLLVSPNRIISTARESDPVPGHRYTLRSCAGGRYPERKRHLPRVAHPGRRGPGSWRVQWP